MLLTLPLASTTAVAGLLYSAGYEKPPFSVGGIDGQDGWLVDLGAPMITSDFSRTGSQSLEIRQGAVEDEGIISFSRQGPYSTSASKIAIRHAFYLTDTSIPFFSPIIAIGDGGFIGQTPFLDGEVGLGLAASIVGSSPIESDQWYLLELFLDFESQTQSAFIDGELIGSGAFASTSTELDTVFVSSFETPSGTAFLDDFSISAVPSPATLWLLISGAAGAFWTGRHREKAA